MKHFTVGLMAMLLLAGCTAPKMQPPAETIKKEPTQPAEATPVSSPAVDGKLEDGYRVVELKDGLSDIHVYRGETLRLKLSADGPITISVPDFEIEAAGAKEVSIDIKAVDAGSFEVLANIGGIDQKAALIVSEYAQKDAYQRVSAAEFEAAMTGTYLLLDVRTQLEYDRGYIEGALLIPHTELAGRLDELEGYDKVLVYCASGNRSVAASQVLIDAGFGEVYDLTGGYTAWLKHKQG